MRREAQAGLTSVRVFAGRPTKLRAVLHHFLVAHTAMLGGIVHGGSVTALSLMQ